MSTEQTQNKAGEQVTSPQRPIWQRSLFIGCIGIVVLMLACAVLYIYLGVGLKGSQAVDNSNPSWSPDGQRIVFASNRESPYGDIYHIFVMNKDGSNITQLTPNYFSESSRYLSVIFFGSDDETPAWSPDGKRIAFENRGDIYLMNSDGSDRVRIMKHNRNYSERCCFYPTWSPDGKRIAFVGRHQDIYTRLFVMNTDGSNLVQLTEFSGFDDMQISWSPDGRYIAFHETIHSTLNFPDSKDNIFRVNSDGTGGEKQLTEGLHILWAGPAWSPDGSRIAFVGWYGGDNGQRYLYVMNADGSGIVKLTPYDPGNISIHNQTLSWSPDGTQIAFSINQIYVINADGTNLVQLTHWNQ